KDGLNRLCREGPRGDPLEAAIALMKRGDRLAAIARFEALRAGRHDAAATLLEGICRYELGDDAQALPLLLEARKEPALSSSADLFLGLISLRRGDGQDAERRFQA